MSWPRSIWNECHAGHGEQNRKISTEGRNKSIGHYHYLGWFDAEYSLFCSSVVVSNFSRRSDVQRATRARTADVCRQPKFKAVKGVTRMNSNQERRTGRRKAVLAMGSRGLAGYRENCISTAAGGGVVIIVHNSQAHRTDAKEIELRTPVNAIAGYIFIMNTCLYLNSEHGFS